MQFLNVKKLELTEFLSHAQLLVDFLGQYTHRSLKYKCKSNQL